MKHPIKTAIAAAALAIALPALVITSFYGMNLKGLPFLDAQYGAYYAIGAIVASTILMLLVMRKARWL